MEFDCRCPAYISTCAVIAPKQLCHVSVFRQRKTNVKQSPGFSILAGCASKEIECSSTDKKVDCSRVRR